MSAVETYDCLPRNFAPQALKTSVVVPNHILVYGFVIYSTRTSSQYVQVFDADALPADTAVPIFSWPLAANTGVGVNYGSKGRQFYAGLVLCNSSTDATKTIGSADCLFDVQYDTIVQYGATGAES